MGDICKKNKDRLTEEVKMKKLWGGRFQSETSNIMEDFNSSIGFDWKLYH